ncbi:hypothetical protein BDN72DRAFT_780642, partial [Pluteus cervinus]
RIARVKVIFKLPERVQALGGLRDAPAQWPKGPLAYVEWYSLASQPEHHGMYKVKRSQSSTGAIQTSIISLSTIRQSCMLIPRFSEDDTELRWTPENVLDLAPSFFVNNWLDMYSYQTIW